MFQQNHGENKLHFDEKISALYYSKTLSFILIVLAHGQATGKLYHLQLRVECTLFVIYKAGRECDFNKMHFWNYLSGIRVTRSLGFL